MLLSRPPSRSSLPSLLIDVEQPAGNRLGVGAWIGVERQGQPTIWRRVRSDGSYLSASDTRVHVGLGTARVSASVLIQWPDGERERWNSIQPNKRVTLRRGSGTRLNDRAAGAVQGFATAHPRNNR